MSTVALAADVDLHRDDEGIVLVRSGGSEGHRLNRTGAAIAECLAVPTTTAHVTEQVVAEFAVGPEEARHAVEELTAELVAHGLASPGPGDPSHVALRRRYLDLLARSLVNLVHAGLELRLEYLERCGPPPQGIEGQRRLRDLHRTESDTFEQLRAAKRQGRVWRHRIGRDSHTMVGLDRLVSLERCAADVFARGVPGDFLEAGVCRGGAAVFLRALQIAYDQPERRTWAADSFAGVPAPSSPIDAEHRLDLSEPHRPWLAATLQDARDTFATYGLLSDHVRFVPGLFAESLPAGVERLALLRIDADLHSSTREVLDRLYDHVSPGGYVVVDDYWTLAPCRRAVDEFLLDRDDGAQLRRVDWNAACWKRPLT